MHGAEPRLQPLKSRGTLTFLYYFLIVEFAARAAAVEFKIVDLQGSLGAHCDYLFFQKD